MTGKKLRTKTKKSGTSTEGEVKDKMEEESTDNMEVVSNLTNTNKEREGQSHYM